MQCELCGNDVDNLIGGRGKKLCQICHDTLIKMDRDYGRRYTDHNQGVYLMGLCVISIIMFFMGFFIRGCV